ncbi:hypothetical protein EX895_002030 [Sporisorium graminicola]|uniref:ABC transporter domain-containing protein n=1 Tax=Sporisorium graminicola TaxID=280036 RepID=A0A4V6EU76_9BASI|nr:hypothetical protein EX895_002030 [Sporisorium graminicola]TKY89499.1 hypothetical protein EX895_002030 [Sporisorium graminicola]
MRSASSSSVSSPAVPGSLAGFATNDSPHSILSPAKQPAGAPSGANYFSWRDITYDVVLSKARRNEIKKKGATSSAPSSASQPAAQESVTQEKMSDAERGIPPPFPDADDSEDEEALAEYNQVFLHLPPLDPMRRRVLNGVSGHVKKGEMVAILGASGAGKTSLLSVLSARLDKSSDIAGQVLFQGKQRDPATWKRLTGFVEQDDLMFSALTVQETLQYSADLRLPNRLYNKHERQQRVQDSIAMLRLEKCRDTRIGGPNQRGVSGGERKRVAVGTELVADVSVLLLDEPTRSRANATCTRS